MHSVDFHLVASQASFGTFHHAIEEGLLPGEIYCIGDSPSIGPLQDGTIRAAFFQKMYQECFGEAPRDEDEEKFIDQHKGALWKFAENDAFAPWVKFAEIIRRESPGRIIIWGSGSGGNYVFLRMACHFLAGLKTTLAYIELPPRDTLYFVEAYPYNELASMQDRLQILSPQQCSMYAEEFSQIAARPEPLRQCAASGQLVFRDISVHDRLVIESCLHGWLPAMRVVGNAMSHADNRNSLSDAFLFSRLRYLLVHRGDEIEADRPFDGVSVTAQTYRVRLGKNYR